MSQTVLTPEETAAIAAEAEKRYPDSLSGPWTWRLQFNERRRLCRDVWTEGATHYALKAKADRERVIDAVKELKDKEYYELEEAAAGAFHAYRKVLLILEGSTPKQEEPEQGETENFLNSHIQ